MTNPQKNKGDNYERELAKYFNDQVFEGRDICGRAPLSGGGFVGLSGGADLIGTTGLFVEAKRVERLNFLDALRQAERNIIKTHAPEAPFVVNRRNRMTTGESLVLMRLDGFLPFYRAWLTQEGYLKPKSAPEPEQPFIFNPKSTKNKHP